MIKLRRNDFISTDSERQAKPEAKRFQSKINLNCVVLQLFHHDTISVLSSKMTNVSPYSPLSLLRCIRKMNAQTRRNQVSEFKYISMQSEFPFNFGRYIGR